jgi:polysaccharide biosynthesis protein PslH
MPSIVDPRSQLGGAWTVTRGIMKLLSAPPLNAEIISVTPSEMSWTAHRARRYVALAQSLMSGLPAKFQFQYSRQMLDTVRRHLADQHFNLLLLNGSDLLWMLPYLPRGTATLLIAHNIEHLLYADQIQVMYPRQGLRKRLLLRDHARLRRHELTGLRAVSNVMCLSTQDEAYVRRECPEVNCVTIPPLFDGTPAARPADLETASRLEIGMLANFGWWPAQQGVRWFLDEVFPQLRANIRLHLFGKGSEDIATEHPGVVKHGYISELDTVWSTCHLMICPVFAGGGVSIKLVEAVCRGVPVIATRYAMRGLPIDSDPAIILRDTPAEWIEFLNSCDALKVRQLSPSSRAIAHFLPKNHLDRLCHVLHEIIEK